MNREKINSLMESDIDNDALLCELVTLAIESGFIAANEKMGILSADRYLYFMKIVVTTADHTWVEINHYLTEGYHMGFSRYAVLTILNSYLFSETGWINEEIDTHARVALKTYMSEIDGTDTKDDHPDMKGVLKEYFALLQELGTFYSDPDKYQSESERTKHARIIELYRKLAQ